MDEKKQLFLASCRDAVGKLFYYDRKEDEELSRHDVDNLVSSGDISVEEILREIRDEIVRNYPHMKKEQA